MSLNERTCFFYHRTNGYDVTIAYRKGDFNHIAYGAAFCATGDQFVKRFGRKIAEGRISTHGHSIDMSGADGKRWEVHEAILKALERCPDYVPENFKV